MYSYFVGFVIASIFISLVKFFVEEDTINIYTYKFREGLLKVVSSELGG